MQLLALIDNKPFFHQSIKNKQEAYEKLVEMSRSYGYTIGNLLDYLCLLYIRHYKLKAKKHHYYLTK